MHDEALCHKSRIAKQFWRENSSDFFPLENSLPLLKNKVFENQFASLAALKNTMKEVWIKFVLRYYSLNLVTTMPRRLQAVKKINVAFITSHQVG